MYETSKLLSFTRITIILLACVYSYCIFSDDPTMEFRHFTTFKGTSNFMNKNLNGIQLRQGELYVEY